MCARNAQPWFACLLVLLTACSSAPTRGPRGERTPATETPAGTDYEAGKLRPAKLSKEMRARCEELTPLIEETAARHDIEPALIQAIVRIESGFRPEARSRAGARGLMQIMPRTGRGAKCGDLHDPEENLDCGARILRRYIDRFDGSLIYGLAAYNGGPGYVKKRFAAQRLPRNFRYVEKVLKMRSFFAKHGCG